ncbi:MAG: FAD-binding protein [Treponema sp.]|nr:FAD-binding protein [Treponema sp.]
MKREITITVLPEEEKNQKIIKNLVEKALARENISSKGHKIFWKLEKKSIDARHGKVKFHLRYNVFIDEEEKALENDFIPKWKKVSEGENRKHKSVIIVGSGPAGLFSALKLLEYGIKPLVIEQGEETRKRSQDIAEISTQGKINSYSNYCFGEGGAGTFSDGKLYTRSNKRGNIPEILQIFNYFGADKKILTDAHPHIGTEKLPGVINNIRDFIKDSGGEFYFNSEVVDFLVNKNKEVLGVKIKNTQNGEEKELTGEAVILGSGHSAYGIYSKLAEISPSSLEAKTFAMGVRVEHKRSLIDSIQFHGQTESLEAAEYHLTTQVEERGVYSFCMCPGGFVVPSSSCDDEIVVNGMSASGRNSQWSNAAIVVETRPEDIPQGFVEKAEKMGSRAIAGLLYRKYIEQLTKNQGEGQKAPAQRMTDFIDGRKSENLPENSYTPGTISSRLDLWLPEAISSRLKEAFKAFNKMMKGYLCPDALLIASETRTSTPVRIVRDKESRECIGLKKLYPVGEGSGYAGGIVSSAMDGVKSAEVIAEKLKK